MYKRDIFSVCSIFADGGIVFKKCLHEVSRSCSLKLDLEPRSENTASLGVDGGLINTFRVGSVYTC